MHFNKQLLDEVEHDIMNYQNRGLCYRLRQITQTQGFDNSGYHAKTEFNNWKGEWKKALSDFWSITILSFQITLYLLEKIRENLTLQKDSLRTLFHAPLQLFYYTFFT